MGQKVNPIGLRLGINRTWDSRWYDDRGYAKLLAEDLKLRAFIERKHEYLTTRVGRGASIGANATIDRGTIRDTRVGSGSKIDNLVQIAHNCQIGEDCIIVAQAGISGSTKIGNNVTLAGQAGLVGRYRFVGPAIVERDAGKALVGEEAAARIDLIEVVHSTSSPRVSLRDFVTLAVEELLLAAGPGRVRERIDLERHRVALLAPG